MNMQLLQLNRPIVLAPMAGGITTPELVAAVSEAGGLGSVGAAYLTPQQIRAAGAATRTLTARPFAVNLFAPQELPEVTAAQQAAAIAELAPLYAQLGLTPPTLPPQVQPDFAAQFEAVLDVHPAVFSFAFGRIERAQLDELKRRGILSIGTATSTEEAVILAADGVEAVVVQGGAAGGHRGGWVQDDFADTLELVQKTVQAIQIPVIAAGGLMTRKDVLAALKAGASLVQCGSAFLRASEAGTSAPYRKALAQAKLDDTVLTRNFSGRTARGLKNTVSEQLSQPLPYPYQNALTGPLRAEAARQGRAELISLWAGQGVWQGREGSAAEILEALCP
ncbi:nitronate monooxygenase [Deinococcus sp.]|uniref:NAD(P)H-dependent flavin oxidoreductase n=1 Tax=Deinococcus sp. TaxID=47478 RepID=UPI0025BDB11A|nr:nitronate monooxygenase [Deinococcus sp.]